MTTSATVFAAFTTITRYRSRRATCLSTFRRNSLSTGITESSRRFGAVAQRGFSSLKGLENKAGNIPTNISSVKEFNLPAARENNGHSGAFVPERRAGGNGTFRRRRNSNSAMLPRSKRDRDGERRRNRYAEISLQLLPKNITRAEREKENEDGIGLLPGALDFAAEAAREENRTLLARTLKFRLLGDDGGFSPTATYMTNSAAIFALRTKAPVIDSAVYRRRDANISRTFTAGKRTRRPTLAVPDAKEREEER